MIVNRRTFEKVSSSEEHANSVRSQLLGLMFRLSIKKPLIFEIKNNRCGVIHMLFVHFDIDIAFLNEDNVITYLQKLKGWSGKLDFNSKVFKIIEFPEGTIIDKDLKIGDELAFL